MNRAWKYLPVLTLVLAGIVLTAYGQPGTNTIRTKELPPPPGMGGPSAPPETAGKSGPPEKAAVPARAPVTSTPSEGRGQTQTIPQHAEGQPPPSMTTELRQDERQNPVVSAGQTEVQNQQPKTSAPSSQQKKRIAAFWLVVPQSETRR